MMPAENIKFGIVISIYNTSKYLGDCVGSLINQEYRDFVVVAVDDASTDNSAALFKQITQYDPRFLLIENTKNCGVSHSRNTALDQLCQLNIDYVTFIDSDDLVTPNFLRDYANVLCKSPVEHLMCGNKFLTQRGIENEMHATNVRLMNQEENFWQFFNWDDWNTPTDFQSFIGGRCFRWKNIENLKFNEEQNFGEDQDFIFKAFLLIKSGAFVESQNYIYRLRSSSISHSVPQTRPELISLLNLYSKISLISPSIKDHLTDHLYRKWWEWAKIIQNNSNDIEKKCFKHFTKRLFKEIPLPKTHKNRFFRRQLLFYLGEKAFNLAVTHNPERIETEDPEWRNLFFP